MQVPPPFSHRVFSASATHENVEVMRSPLRAAFGAVVGGIQLAAVNMSTNFRTKYRGNVPPRFDTL